MSIIDDELNPRTTVVFTEFTIYIYIYIYIYQRNLNEWTLQMLSDKSLRKRMASETKLGVTMGEGALFIYSISKSISKIKNPFNEGNLWNYFLSNSNFKRLNFVISFVHLSGSIFMGVP